MKIKKINIKTKRKMERKSRLSANKNNIIIINFMLFSQRLGFFNKFSQSHLLKFFFFGNHVKSSWFQITLWQIYCKESFINIEEHLLNKIKIIYKIQTKYLYILWISKFQESYKIPFELDVANYWNF